MSFVACAYSNYINLHAREVDSNNSSDRHSGSHTHQRNPSIFMEQGHIFHSGGQMSRELIYQHGVTVFVHVCGGIYLSVCGKMFRSVNVCV